MNSSCIVPQWPAPSRVRALITTRSGGGSAGCFAENNLGLHVGDDPERVTRNRENLLRLMDGAEHIRWLSQVHSADLVEAGSVEKSVLKADGCTTTKTGVACAVLTADCLPLLLCDRSGGRVTAVHAGWRGLAAGILPKAIEQFDSPHEVLVYLGPAISQPNFEVGEEVRAAFLQSTSGYALGPECVAAIEAAFKPSKNSGRWMADLYAIARAQSQAMGVVGIYGGSACTFAEKERFYSFRRDGQTGRMASLIWLA